LTPRLAWIALVLTACSADLAIVGPTNDAADGAGVSAGDDTDVTVDLGNGCEAKVTTVSPGPEAVLVPVDAPVVMRFSAPLPDGQAWSLALDGVVGRAELSADRQSAVFTPDAPLEPETTYTVVGSTCEDLVEQPFTPRGAAVTVDALLDRSWAMDPSEAEWLAPATASVFATLLDLPNFLLQVDASSGAPRLIGRFAADTGLGLLPVPCAPVLDFGVLDLSDSPRFSTTQDVLQFRWLGLSIDLSALHLSGSFSHGGAGIAELSFSGLLDTRIVEAMTGVQALCRQSAEFGQACEPCADGATACLQTFIVQHSASESPATDLYSDFLADHGLCQP
jgi:hypothetical protein